MRFMHVRVFLSWREFIEFLAAFKAKDRLEKLEFHQDGSGQIVVRFQVGEPDALKRAGYFARGEG
jgi:hypothetical protein